jgi:NAD-dependent dihydropyrimidine dehydrogenase PreA subunit
MNKDKSTCDETSGKLVPLINLSNCGGKEKCIPACPYDVLEMRTITEEGRLTLNFKGKIKTFFKPKKAYVKDPALCYSCGICVQVCPEKAIKLSQRNA